MSGSSGSSRAAKAAGPNPFIGPRPFETGEKLYGRDRELAELIDRLNAERIILLHSPSGAGKSSLIQAGLLPELTRSFDVWGPTRVNLEPPAGEDSVNRYVASANLGFEEAVPEKIRRPAEIVAGQTLPEYFTGRPRRRRAPRSVLLVFDQFEEVLTAEPLAVAAKRAFFDQLGDLLRNPRIWALFALREDYLAPLEGGIELAADGGEARAEITIPYARRVPTHFKNRFRIDLLSLGSAREAMVEPAAAAGREFPAVDRLVRDLATMKVQLPDGSFRAQTGHYVEPVQLQVVCRRLWDAMPADDLSIDPEDLEEFGDVSEALGAYYDDSVARVAGGEVAALRATAVERDIREWFDQRLITAGGVRDRVLMERGTSGGLANQLIACLRDSHLVRAEQRAGATWFELAHDRLIEPVCGSNAAWLKEHLSEVQKRASLWEKQDRPPGLLMKDEELAAGERWAAENEAGLTGDERRFLEESRKAHDAAERERRQARWIKVLAVAAVIVALLAGWQWREARTQAEAARQADAGVRDAMRISAAREKTGDPSLQVALLREVETENPQALRGWQDLARTALGWPLAEDVFLGHEEKVISVTRDGARVVTVSADGTARVRDLGGSTARVLRGHRGRVKRAVFSPGGQRVVTTAEDNFALLWNAANSNDPVTLGGHQNQVVSAVFSPGGRRVLTTDEDDLALLWKVDGSGGAVKLWEDQEHVAKAAFSAGGSRIVTRARGDASRRSSAGELHSTARVWSADGDELAVLPHRGQVWNVAIDPGGSRVVTVVEGDDSRETAQIWNVDGEQLAVLEGHDGKAKGAAFSPDGTYVMVASRDGNVRIWSVDDPGEPVELPYDGMLKSAAFGPAGQRVLTFSTNGEARVWNADGSAEPIIIPGTEGQAASARLSPDGSRVVTVSDTGVRLWQADGSGEPVVLLWHVGGAPEAAVTFDGKGVVTASDDSVRRWSVEGSSEPVLLRHDESVERAVFSPDGERVITVSGGSVRMWKADGSGEPLALGRSTRQAALSPDAARAVTVSSYAVQVWDADGSQLPVALPGRAPNDLKRVGLSSDGTRAVTVSGSGTVRLWTDSRVVELGSHDPVYPSAERWSAAFSPDGTRAVTAARDLTARVWTVEPAGGPIVLEGHEDQVLSAAFSPDGERVVTASEDGTARVWAADGSGELTVLRHGKRVSSAVLSAAFSPGGERVVTASRDRTARVWLADGEELAVLRGHGQSVSSAAFGPGGERVVTASADGARVWTAGGEELAVLWGHGQSASSAAFSPDGERVVTASADGARVWSLDLLPLLWKGAPFCLSAEDRSKLLGQDPEMAEEDAQHCREMVRCRRGDRTHESCYQQFRRSRSP